MGWKTRLGDRRGVVLICRARGLVVPVDVLPSLSWMAQAGYC